jgi:hypothetical protein
MELYTASLVIISNALVPPYMTLKTISICALMKAMILRVGIDKGTDEVLAPIFEDAVSMNRRGANKAGAVFEG